MTIHIPYKGKSKEKRLLSSSEHSAISLLETAALAHDVIRFQALVNAIPWANQKPVDIVAAIRFALALEAPLMARQIAEQGIKQYPAHPEIKKMARILAPPTVTATPHSNRIDIKANQLWLKANRENYRLNWVALHNGKLLASAQTFADLTAEVGDIKGKSILLTQVT